MAARTLFGLFLVVSLVLVFTEGGMLSDIFGKPKKDMKISLTSSDTTDCNYTGQAAEGNYTLPTGSNGRYNNHMSCHIVLQTDPGPHTIEVRFSYFDLENDYRCRYDRLDIKVGNTTEDELCGSLGSFHKRYEVNGEELTMTFTSDISYTSRGFAFTSYILPDCNAHNRELQGRYVLPTMADGKYASDVTCNIVLESVDHPHVTTVNFEYFDVEPQFSCLFDYLEVETGGTIESRLCGNFEPFVKQYRSSDPFLNMTFVSDSSVSGGGFAFTYITQTDCNYTTKDLSGSYTLPTASNGKYQNNQQCHILLQSEPGRHVIEVDFTYFDLEMASGCYYDSLIVKAGSKTLDVLCGNLGSITKRYDTEETDLTMTFSSDSSYTKRGFAFNFSTYTIPDCDFNSKELEGQFTLPTLGNGKYATDLDCNIVLESVAEPHVVTVNFTYFDVEPEFSCLFDYLEVKAGNTTVDRLCGNLGPFVKQYRTSEPILTMTFVSDFSVMAEGFAFDFTTETELTGEKWAVSSGQLLPDVSLNKAIE